MFGHSRRTWVFSRLRGIQNYFPENFRCNLTYYEGDNFSDSFFHHIFESENFRIPFYLRKIGYQGRKMWKIKLQKILENLLAWLHDCFEAKWKSELWKTSTGLIAAHFFVHFLAFDLHDYNVKRPETSSSRFMEEMWYMFLFTFSTAAHFF